LLPLLLPGPALRLDRIEITDPTITLYLDTTNLTACCLLCGQPTRHVHSHYTRQVHDLPIQGRPALLRLTARRFFCRTPDCPRRVFCEPLPPLVARHAHATARLTDAHRNIGLAVGGEAGSRLAAKLGLPTSADTLLRRIKQARSNAAPAPRIIGVDDWAMRKGFTYGTIIIDLERGEVLELLPGRDGVALKTWLSQHPDVEVLSRDRWAAYAEAATEAAPQARQVADRWHLLKNIREALERFLERRSGAIAHAFAPPAPSAPAHPPDPEVVHAAVPLSREASGAVGSATRPATGTSSPPQRPVTAKQQRRLERFHEVRRRHSAGQSIRSIARAMGLSGNAVRRYVRSDHCPDWRPGRVGPSQAAMYQQRIDAWLATGQRNMSALHRQLQAEDPTLRYDTLRRFVLRRLAARGEPRERAKATRSPPLPSARSLSFAVLARPDKATPGQQVWVALLRAISPEVAQAVALVQAFAALVRKDGGTTLKDWQDQALHSTSPELKRFAEGLSRDQTAVEAALKEPWSNGPVEGHINRLKTIKRQMYGRVGLALLRARVLHAG
jgi:transposase